MAVAEWQYGSAALGFNLDPTSDADWDEMDGLYAALYDRELSPEVLRPLRQILAIVRAGGCRTLVVERNYIDLDYRSEYSAFWSRLFEDKPAIVPRLHFFSHRFGLDELHEIPEPDSYLGYSVLRPTELGPVGRTLLRKPPWASAAKITEVTETPTLFGTPLPFAGVPFYQQDGQLMRCAHVVAWTAHYAASDLAAVARVPAADIALLPPAVASRYRPLPASGLTMEQLQYLLTSLGLPALVYEVNNLPPVPGTNRWRYTRLRGIGPPTRSRRRARADYRDRILRVACKYLNSGLPVIVLTSEQHAFTLVGWERLAEDSVRLLACDDQVGPYVIVDPLETGHCGAWESLMVPVPEKVLLAGEAAERRALDMLLIFAARSSDPRERDVHRFAENVAPRGPGSVRARLMAGKDYKVQLGARGLPEAVVRMFRFADLSHWVWVVELHDRNLRGAQSPCVRAEIVFDSTSHDDDPSAHLAITPSTALDVGVYLRQHGQPGPSEGLFEGQINPWESIIADA